MTVIDCQLDRYGEGLGCKAVLLNYRMLGLCHLKLLPILHCLVLWFEPYWSNLLDCLYDLHPRHTQCCNKDRLPVWLTLWVNTPLGGHSKDIGCLVGKIEAADLGLLSPDLDCKLALTSSRSLALMHWQG